MGDTLSDIADDIDEYLALCKQFSEPVQRDHGSPDCYGPHARALKERARALNADELPTEPGILTEAEHQAHREADTMARVERIEARELQVPSHADSELLWLAQLARELWKTILAQRTTIAGMEQGQGILGDSKVVSEQSSVVSKWSTTTPEQDGFYWLRVTEDEAPETGPVQISTAHYPDDRGDIRLITFCGQKGNFILDELTFPIDAKVEWASIAQPTP